MPIAQPMPTPVSHTDIANRTRKFFVPCVGGRNTSDSIDLSLDHSKGWILTDAKICSATGFFTCPEDYVTSLTLTAVVVSDGTGNCRSTPSTYYGTDGEDYNQHDSSAEATNLAVVAGKREFIALISLPLIAKGDVVCAFFTRTGNHGDDTVNAAVQIQGWIVEYTADM